MKVKKMKVKSLSRVQLFATQWTVAYQAPPSMGFSRQEYWSELPCPPPGDLLDLGIKLASSMSPAVAGGFFTTSAKIVKVKSFSRVRLFVTPWTVAYQAPQSMEFSRQEYWNGLPCPPPGDLLDLGIELHLLHFLQWQADSLPSEPPGKPVTPHYRASFKVQIVHYSDWSWS